jgi:multidrug efflux pump subunit AcrB
MTLTLAAVYAPIAFIGGLTGALFSEFALTLAGAVLVSGIVALTLSPMMASRFLTSRHGDRGALPTRWTARFAALNGALSALLAACLANRGAVLLFSAGILLSLPCAVPGQPAGAGSGGGHGIDLCRGQRAELRQPRLHQALSWMRSWRSGSDIPEISQLLAGRPAGQQLRRPDDGALGRARAHASRRCRRSCRAKLAGIAGMEMFSFGTPSLPGSPMPGLPGELRGRPPRRTTNASRPWASGARAARRRNRACSSSSTRPWSSTGPEVSVEIDRELAARLGISMRDIATTLAMMLGEAEINRFTRDGRSYKVIPQAGRSFPPHRRANWRSTTCAPRRDSSCPCPA